MTTQFVYKKMYLVVIQDGGKTKKSWINTDTAPVPKRKAQR